MNAEEKTYLKFQTSVSSTYFISGMRYKQCILLTFNISLLIDMTRVHEM
jgi:hypothetical protein